MQCVPPPPSTNTYLLKIRSQIWGWHLTAETGHDKILPFCWCSWIKYLLIIIIIIIHRYWNCELLWKLYYLFSLCLWNMFLMSFVECAQFSPTVSTQAQYCFWRKGTHKSGNFDYELWSKTGNILLWYVQQNTVRMNNHYCFF